jgi:hypothetical protein
MVHHNITDCSRVPDQLYIQSELFGVGGFPFLLVLLVLVYSKATDNSETGLTFLMG